MLSAEEQKSRSAEEQSAQEQSADHNQHRAPAKPVARARGAITFDYATAQLDGITDSHRERWATAYPAVEIEQQVAAAAAWLAANPKQRKKNIERFLTNWLSRQQERGGTRQPRVSSISPRTFDEVPEHLRF
jgi:cytoskeletal protein RodZ